MARGAGLRVLEVLGYLSAIAIGLAGVVIHYDVPRLVRAAGPLTVIGLVLCVLVVVRFLAIIATTQLEKQRIEPRAPSRPRGAEAREEVTR